MFVRQTSTPTARYKDRTCLYAARQEDGSEDVGVLRIECGWEFVYMAARDGSMAESLRSEQGGHMAPKDWSMSKKSRFMNRIEWTYGSKGRINGGELWIDQGGQMVARVGSMSKKSLFMNRNMAAKEGSMAESHGSNRVYVEQCGHMAAKDEWLPEKPVSFTNHTRWCSVFSSIEQVYHRRFSCY